MRTALVLLLVLVAQAFSDCAPRPGWKSYGATRLSTGPVLFDVIAGSRPVKGIASLGKTCYAYIWDRVSGTPLNPMVETAVPTTTDVPGEQVWPTQPIPYTSRGVP